MRPLLLILVLLILLAALFPWVRRRLTVSGLLFLSGFAIFLLVVSLTHSYWR